MKLWLHRVDVEIMTHVVSVNNLTPGSTLAFCFAYFLILQNNKSRGEARELVSVHMLLALKSQV